jgi:conserved oligomeric Golgi complex subunit 4
MIQCLETVLSSQSNISRDLGQFDRLRAGLGSQVVAVRAIANDKLSETVSTAERLSKEVKELDLEKSRVEETLEVVKQVTELKACVHGVVGSMGVPQD